MTPLTIHLPSDVYECLRATAAHQGKPVEEIATAVLVEHASQPQVDLTQPAPPGERGRAIAVLRNAGMVAELSSQEKARAARSTLTLQEARAILDRVPGKPLSEMGIEMRGPKE